MFSASPTPHRILRSFSRFSAIPACSLLQTVAALCEAILRNEHRVLPLSVPVKGLHGILHDVYLSLPAVVGIQRSGFSPP